MYQLLPSSTSGMPTSIRYLPNIANPISSQINQGETSPNLLGFPL